MKRKTITLALAVSYLFSIVSPALVFAKDAPRGGAEKTFLAVLDFDCKGGLNPGECSLLSDSLRERLFKTGKYRVVDRNNMDRILEEQGFQLSDLADCTDQSCAVKVGRLLGVKEMAFGSIGQLGEEYMISVQTINVETGEIAKIGSRRFIGSVNELVVPINGIAFEIAGVEEIPVAAAKTSRPWYKKGWIWVLLLGIAGGGAYGAYAVTSDDDGGAGDSGRVEFQY